jgi:hypothetical protein
MGDNSLFGDLDSDLQSKITEQVTAIRKGILAERVDNSSKGYASGAIAGVIIGLLAATYFEKNKIIFGILGLSLGGYFGQKIGESKNFTLKPKY